MKFALVPLLAQAFGGTHSHPSSSQNDMNSNIPLLDITNMDPTTSPLDNFYQYVNGGWLEKNSIPPDSTEYDAYKEIANRIDIDLESILEEASKNPGDLLGDIFYSGMNDNGNGLEVISDLFSGINNIRDKNDVLSFLGSLHAENLGNSFFCFTPQPDSRNSRVVLGHLSIAELGLGGQEYYLDAAKNTTRDKYVEHIGKMLGLANEKHPEQRAVDAFEIEKFIANFLPKLEDYDPIEEYHKYSYDGLKSHSNLDWDGFFTNLGLTPNSFGDIIIDNPQYFKSLPKVFEKFTKPQVNNYLKWFLLRSTKSYLPEKFQQESFQFFGEFLSGQEQQIPKWKKVMKLITPVFGNLLSRRYIEKRFPKRVKDQTLSMVDFLLDAFRERIEKLNWIDESTRTKALEKLNNIKVKIGGPESNVYGKFELNRNSPFLHNIRIANRLAVKKEMETINKELDRTIWDDESYDVNAYYYPNLNEIILPAAILQPVVFFSSKENFQVDDMAFNFGGIGATIGHELTHGFDNIGRKYDSEGNLVDWWTEKDSKSFEDRSQKIIKHFNDLEFYNQKVNGKLTLGENIADLGGLIIAYDAFQKWMKKNREPKVLHGFTPNQQFFIAYAQSWRSLITEEEALDRLQSDSHAPAIHRTNQPLLNMQEFYDAFGEPTSAQGMYRTKEDRVEIW